MKFDFRWNSTVHWWARILGALLSLLFIPVGLLAIISGLQIKPFVFDSSFKFGISSLTFGIICLIAAIRGRVFGKKDEGEK
jgi:hypothetical protein